MQPTTQPARPSARDITPSRGTASALSEMPPARRAELRAAFGPDAERAAEILREIAFGTPAGVDSATDRD